ncbi:unnamed protein product [Blepharisma stoltei]|uniref:RING-type domain-containing protein n=1 Tax=Blepharisma stoltei TaxID=1481888 RepID=A0AAU9JMM5_9CILI|nr:unnamed protein product [Blepharisma stoltei]
MSLLSKLKYFTYYLSTKLFLFCCLTIALIFIKLLLVSNNLRSQTLLLIGWISATFFMILLRIYFLARRMSYEEQQLMVLDLVIQNSVERYIEQLNETNIQNTNYTMQSQDITGELLHLEAEEEGFCSICMNDITKGQIITVLKCPHKFHSECVDTWLETKPSCPVCKKIVSVNNLTEYNYNSQEFFIV